MEIDETFWSAQIDDLRKGFIENRDNYECLLCSKIISKGIIYPDNEILYEPESYMKLHIEKTHKSVFNYLINLDKKITGLSDHQKKLLQLFYEGKSDSEIQNLTGIGSSSTIRNHRFVLKEKERQSKIFLTIMELLKQKDKGIHQFININKTAKMVDDRYNITLAEKDKIIKKYFPDGSTKRLINFPPKEKIRLLIVGEIIKNFNKGFRYTEKEVNEIITKSYDDYAIIRRYLIEYGFLDRKPDGSQYWVK